jgi:hypothetical protein
MHTLGKMLLLLQPMKMEAVEAELQNQIKRKIPPQINFIFVYKPFAGQTTYNTITL